MEMSISEWDELRHRQRVADAVKKMEYKLGEQIENMPKKERKPYVKRVKTAARVDGVKFAESHTEGRELAALREVEHQRRVRAGAQLRSDHDNSARWIGELPTFNPSR